MPKGGVRALVVGAPEGVEGLRQGLQAQGFAATGVGDPYAAMTELCRRPLVYRTLVLSLQGVYQEELKIIPAVKRRFAHVEIFLAHTDGRAAALAEGMRLGADGLWSEQGVHRTGAPSGQTASNGPTPATSVMPPAGNRNNVPVNPPAAAVQETRREPVRDAGRDVGPVSSEPILTAEELKALLGDDVFPPSNGGGE